MIIYSNGCSHTFGHCVGVENSYPSLIMKKLSNDFYSHTSNIEQFDIKNVVNETDILINESRCGVGNDYIFHKSLESINKLIKFNRNPNYVMIQWSGPNRRLYCTHDGQYLNVNNFDNVKYYVKFEPMGSEHTIHYMFSLQEFLKKNKIKYFFINYFPLDESIKKLSIFHEIDLDNFINFNSNDNVLMTGIIDFLKKINCLVTN